MPNNWGWRIPSLLQVLPSLLQISFIWLIPESPRWLVSKGRGSEAYAILVKYHAEGDENSNFVKAEYAQIKQTLEAELKIAQTGRKDVFSTPGMRKRVIVASFLGLFTQWSGTGLISLALQSISICQTVYLLYSQTLPRPDLRKHWHSRQPDEEHHQSCQNFLELR